MKSKDAKSFHSRKSITYKESMVVTILLPILQSGHLH